MEAPRRTILAVLSAEAQCVERLRRLCGECEGLVLVFANEPGELLLGIVASLTQSRGLTPCDLAGILVDLTIPRSRSAHDRRPAASKAVDDQTSLEAATEIIRGVNNLLSALKTAGAVPLIAVSLDGRLPAHLDAKGVALHGSLSPADDDATWRQALDALVASSQGQPRQDAPRRTRRHTERVIPPPSAIPLRDDLWFDQAACELLRQRRRDPLTGRESCLLAILLRTPNTYILTSELAERLTPPGRYPVDAHSIEQTISTLRSKLGERKGQPCLLLVRRGVGYGIFPQSSEAIQASAVADTRATAVEFSRRRPHKT